MLILCISQHRPSHGRARYLKSLQQNEKSKALTVHFKKLIRPLCQKHLSSIFKKSQIKKSNLSKNWKSVKGSLLFSHANSLSIYKGSFTKSSRKCWVIVVASHKVKTTLTQVAQQIQIGSLRMSTVLIQQIASIRKAVNRKQFSKILTFLGCTKIYYLRRLGIQISR